MTSTLYSSLCGQCCRKIDEPRTTMPVDRKPCPSCGSFTRRFHVHITESITVREKLGMKLKRPGGKKLVYESVIGDDLHRATGQWNNLTREIDRENNRYKEVIVDPLSGAVIRECDEARTDHAGRGSAKRKAMKLDKNA